MQNSASNNVIKSFVLTTLGCGCPESVFEQIAYDGTPALPALDGRLQRLVIGNRLLIYIVEADDAAALRALLPLLLETGKAERDRNAYNRLRIVVAAANPESIRPDAESVFLGADGMDEKVHLHVLSREISSDAVRRAMTGPGTT